MTIEMGLEAKGLDGISEILKSLNELQGKIVIDVRPRTGRSTDTNAEILEYLADRGKDYTSLSTSDLERVSKAYVVALDKELQKDLNGAAKGKKVSNNTKKKALEAALKVAADIVADNVEAGGSVRTGQLLRNLQTGNIRITK